MAIVLDAFASYVQNMLTEMANEEVHMLLGVRDEIDKMGVKLKDLKKFLADADRRNITDESVQEWVGQLKRAMYEATDILDLCQLKATEWGPSTLDVGCFNPLLFCLRNPLHAHDIGSRIKALNKKLDTIKERSAAFSFINLGSYEDHGHKVHASRPGNHSRETSGELDLSCVVGEKIEEDTRALVEIMLAEKPGSNNIKVVAIVGVGGIGKTTLAKKVFNDETINAKFDTTIWLSINQDFDKVEMLRTAITRVKGDHCGEKALAVLEPTLTAALTGKKLFLVMDDVWSHRAWSEVLETPLVNAVARGSRVLITTRDERVARGMKAVLPHHHVDNLEEEDAWTLLKKQVVSGETDGPEIDMLKDIGLKIVSKCGGLPLAIKVMGGLLCQKDKQRRDWEMVLNDSIWSVSEMPEELNNAVYLSYEDLPPSMKQCFLFYSLLPKTALFLKNDIIGMWISEGFLHETSDDLEELGSKYHKELILRNLIEPDTDYIDQSVCNMHDVVRSFAQFVARDEALAAHSGETGITSKLRAQKFLRLSLESKVSESDGLDWSSLQAQKTLRTLISAGHINMKPGDTLVNFPCLRTLHLDSANVAALVKSLDQLKHLRYLSIHNSDIARLPDNIGKMKFLQYISLQNCQQLLKLPHSIVKLEHLRFLHFHGTSINCVPRGFCVLTNLRKLHGFPVEVDGDWCSLEELGPLSQLRTLGLRGLENVSTNLSAAEARLGEKEHLTNLELTCNSRLGDDGMIKEEEQRRIEEVFDEFCPPLSLDNLDIIGYFGRRLPSWMMSSPAMPLKSLRILFMSDLACCTQLPDGLSQLPLLEFIQIQRAPSIKRVGPEFLQPYHHHSRRPSTAATTFRRLREMNLGNMVEWEEWEWEEQVQAFPVLEVLQLTYCKLRHVPPGLASHARALKKLKIEFVQHLSYLENFASVVELTVNGNPDLERITNLPSLQKLVIDTCPRLDVLKGVRALQRLVLQDYAMGTLPEYMRDVNPRHLELRCSLALLTSIAAGKSGPEWDKFCHVEHVKAYAADGDNPRKWYVLYTREPCNLDTNISRSFLSGGTLLSSMVDAQGFESVFKMRRRTFSYVCCLVNDDMMVRDSSYTFADGRVMCLEDRVAVALTLLNSGDPPETVGSSVGVNKSTVWLVTESFLDAMIKRIWYWPDSSEKEKIKYKFDKIHGLPNCCGVIHATHIPFGPSCDHEKNNSVLMQALVDPDMRFTSIWLGPADSMNQSSILLDSDLFKKCEKGEWLNGNMLKVSSDGAKVGEYIIGDAGYPLLPWLLTPYQEEDLSESKAEFNRRHSAARTLALQALARLEDTWKCLHGGMWCSDDTYKLSKIIYACCKLHNIVIDMEEADMARGEGANYSKQVRRLADEDAIKVRDILSQHLIESGGTLLSSMVDAQGFESVFKMRRRTFSYVCCLVNDDMMVRDSSYTFADGRVMCLEDRVAVALTLLNSGDPPETVGSSVGVNKSTVWLVTESFLDAMIKRIWYWPDSSEKEKIKYKFDKIHGLPNCCGVIHATHIPFGPSCDHEKNNSVLMQALVDPDMRFTSIWLGPADSMNQSSILLDSDLFKKCEKGEWLNGNMLKVSSDGAKVGEYIIGDAGYPLLPWLLTPYQEEDLSESKAEFNRRHSAARTLALQALARLEDTWKCLHGGMWCSDDTYKLSKIIYACCKLHNIVIDMEEADMARGEGANYSKQVRRLADEDAIKVRDILSQHLIESGGTLLSSMVEAQGFESVFKMRRRTFSYVCCLVNDDMMVRDSSYTFADGRVMCLEDRVAVALTLLNSGEPPETVGSFVGVNESTVWLVTECFLNAMFKRIWYWPDSCEMEKIKYKFDKIHGLPNCCGVIHTTHIPFGPSCDHEKNNSVLMQALVDPDMRFTNIFSLGSADSMNQSSILLDSDLFKECEKGEWLNGNKLKVSSDGSEVGEYVIGDAGYPLLPWLLTPYQEEDLSESKAEFNRRHSAARTLALQALARLEDTWKCLHGGMWCPDDTYKLGKIIYACCTLHNIVIDMEEADMARGEGANYSKQVRRLADEDAIRVRDILSQHLIESGGKLTEGVERFGLLFGWS